MFKFVLKKMIYVPVLALSVSLLMSCSDNSSQENTNNTQTQNTDLSVSPETAGARLYATCAGCHGERGEGGIGPKLAQQSQADIKSKLLLYKSGQTIGENGALMIPMAKILSDEGVEQISAYIALKL